MLLVWRSPNFLTIIAAKLLLFIFPGGGGGGGTSILYAYWVCAARETPIFSPEFPFRSIIIFTNYQRIRSGASPFYIFWRILSFRRPSVSKISLNSTRSAPHHSRLSPNAAFGLRRGLTAAPERQPDASWQFWRVAFSRSKRIKLVPEPRIFKLKTAQARSGAPHFHARPGARSGTRAHFSLCRVTYMYLPKFGGEYPPPPPGHFPFTNAK